MRAMAGLIGALMMVVGAASAATASPVGVWDLETGDTRIEVHLCADGEALCGTLVWLKDTEYNQKYRQFLNSEIVRGAAPAGAGRWRGEISYMGQKAAGTITQTGQDHLTLRGCAFVVVCKTYQLYRYSE